MTTKTHWLLALCASSVTLIAAGCGGDDKNTSGATTGGGGAEAAEQVITVNWGTEPPSLDPGLATDTTSSNILLNIMDPLVKLDADLNPVGSAAASFETSDDGKTVTYVLRDGVKWTNGDPVTAGDFEYSWKRTLSPELGADYAYQFYGIVGAQEYNSCDPKKDQCAALADKVGVKAVDDKTLEVKLTTPQPWFIQQSAHTSFLAVNKKAVEKFGDKWTEPANIVTNGPFKLDSWEHNANINLVKWDGWRDAANVKLTRVNGRMISDGTTAVQAFEAKELDVLYQGLPVDEISRLKETPEYDQYPGLGTYYYGFNVRNITDVKQRRAMSLAIDRRSIIDNIAQADQLPTTGFTPKGMPGFDVIDPKSPWQPETADLEQAKQLMSEVANPKTKINLYINDSPGHKDIAVAIQAAWKELGITSTIKQQEFQQYLEFLGPPPNSDVDVYRLGWIGDFVDAINFLDLWTCKSGNNNTNFCNKDYDAVIAKAKQTPDTDARYKLYREAEDILGGENGEMPVLPIYWYTYTNLERESVKDTFNVNLLNQTDLTKVVVTK
ncbi:MAG: oligopeptide transport system substrate-binding protein [Gaiellaceae bacterium]|jgi:ABC-type oligopeptide transport system substrate-binding subunit|nr:oligopeptide transport system substrate-binding protein [Gaiellaceae bacterium]